MSHKDPILKSQNKNGRLVNAVGGLHYLRGNSKPHFSLTIASWVRGREDMFGCAHDEILKIWPSLKPLADLHLSDIDGVPMHAAENGLYYVQHLIPGCSGYGPLASSFADPGYGQKRSDEECIQIMADHFRISLNEARGLLAALIFHAESVSQYKRVYEGGAKPVVKAAVACWVEAQKPRWKAEADKAIADLGLVVYGDKYEPAVAA
jgi:hypothetical protein